jgi:hypothetical protein
VGDVADVSEVHATVIFRVELCRLLSIYITLFRKGTGEVGIVPRLVRYEQRSGKIQATFCLVSTWMGDPPTVPIGGINPTCIVTLVNTVMNLRVP